MMQGRVGFTSDVGDGSEFWVEIPVHRHVTAEITASSAAQTAEIGLEWIHAHRPDAVILDINLPGMSGFDAMQRLRESPETRHIPVIGLSAGALLRDTTRANELGFYHYLTKPVKVAELTKVLEDLLVRSAR